MPNGDRTGPEGFGSMSGRAAGFCAGYSTPGYGNSIGRRGFFGIGRGSFGGRGRGFKNRFFANEVNNWSGYNRPYPISVGSMEYTKEEEMEILKNQSKYMQGNIDSINERIKELESKE